MISRLLTGMALVVFFVSGCSENKPLKIGFVGALTGRNGDLGTAGRDGALLAVESINAVGGVGGRKLELVIRDDKSDPEEAKRVVRELVDSKVAAIVGPMTSSMASATIPIVDASKILMLSPTVSGSGSDFMARDDYFIRLNLNSDVAAATAEKMKKMGINNVALIYDMANKSYSASLVDAFKTKFTSLGGLIAADQPFSSKEKPNLTTLAQSAIGKKPGGILIVAGALDSAMLCQQLNKLGSTFPVFIAEWAGTSEFLKAGGGAVSGVYIFQHFNSDSTNPAFVSFKNDYIKRFGDLPPFAATYSYEAVSIITEAIKKDANISRIKETIIGLHQFKGLQSDIVIDKNGDPIRPFSLMQVRDGRFAMID